MLISNGKIEIKRKLNIESMYGNQRYTNMIVVNITNIVYNFFFWQHIIQCEKVKVIVFVNLVQLVGAMHNIRRSNPYTQKKG